jgi:hypothetical protein
MLVYTANKKQFLHDCDYGDIEEVIKDKFKAVTGRGVAPNEIKSWQSSLSYIAKVLQDPAIDENIGVAIEMHIPQTSMRIDVALSGFGTNKQKNVIIIELKQWDKVEKTTQDGIVITYMGGGLRSRPHPSYQAWSYACLLEGFNEAVYKGGINLKPCAYLHNYHEDGIINDAHYLNYIDKAPLFLKGGADRDLLRDFIKKNLIRGDSCAILHELDSSPIRPSKTLADSLVRLMKSNSEFNLIDDQKVTYEGTLAAAKTASSMKPRVVIIEGGPGTGKTVLAIQLLVQLTSIGLTGKYVSKNAAPREIYKFKLTRTSDMTQPAFSNLFSGSGAFTDSKPDNFDFLIVDEAHRLNEKSGLYANKGVNQIKELISAAKCAVFFLDENQRVTLNDIGEKTLIEKFAEERGASIEKYELISQFRCNGSGGYLPWLDQALGIEKPDEERKETLSVSTEFEFKVFENPETLHQEIIAKNTENKARIVAGYCWPWNSKKDSSADDIIIGDYKRQWNLNQDGNLWIISSKSVDQIGCIHTCQGLELDYIGVLIGPDLIIRNKQVVTNPSARARHDKSIQGYQKLAKKNPQAAAQLTDIIIKNTYRTLMTRGKLACYIYSADKETREYFLSKLVP